MKSTTQTSRKIFAMKAAFKLILQILVFYICGKTVVATYNFLSSFYLNECIVISPINEGIFIAAIVAIGTIVSALNIADGMKGHEEKD
jgi:UDP-N-acetylmuramyl pentapeptide phosphotransferase/UDP-N-acetylglucosamine-1-phosphate transferase